MKGTIGLDIGGTKILGALFDEKGAIVKRVKKKTKADKGIETVRTQILKLLDQLTEDEDLQLQGIGAGAPGIILEGKTVRFSPNIPFRNENLAELIQAGYDVPFVVGNDVNVAMFGEWQRGKYQEKRNVIGLFIGGVSVVMGIGGGTLSVPTFTLFGMEIRRAVGTAAAIGLVIAIPGTIGFAASGWGEAGLPVGSVGYVNLIGFALVAPLSMALAPLGAKLAHTIPRSWLSRAFALFLGVTGARMLWSLLG